MIESLTRAQPEHPSMIESLTIGQPEHPSMFESLTKGQPEHPSMFESLNEGGDPEEEGQAVPFEGAARDVEGEAGLPVVPGPDLGRAGEPRSTDHDPRSGSPNTEQRTLYTSPSYALHPERHRREVAAAVGGSARVGGRRNRARRQALHAQHVPVPVGRAP